MNQRNLGPDNQSNNKKMGHVNYIVSSKKKEKELSVWIAMGNGLYLDWVW